MKRCWIVGAVALFGLVLILDTSSRGGDKKEITIKQVMKAHAKGGLLEKVSSGDASKEEKQHLVELYVALGKNKPPRGDEEAWKEKTEALVKAVKNDDVPALKKAVNCAACHKEFKKAKPNP